MQFSNELRKKLKGAKNVCVLTGAGISAESGVPTFRGGGESLVWKGMPFDQISSARMVKEDLNEVWEWFNYRRRVYRKCEPNHAHLVLANWEHHFENFLLVTQNVDGLHTRAGSKKTIEVHGNINRSRCDVCKKTFQMTAEEIPHDPKFCVECNKPLRPDVVLFGEMLPEGTFETASEEARRCDVFFVIGTSALVYPAALLPEIAKENKAFIIEINPEETPLSDFCDESIHGKAGEVLPLINELLFS